MGVYDLPILPRSQPYDRVQGSDIDNAFVCVPDRVVYVHGDDLPQDHAGDHRITQLNELGQAALELNCALAYPRWFDHIALYRREAHCFQFGDTAGVLRRARVHFFSQRMRCDVDDKLAGLCDVAPGILLDPLVPHFAQANTDRDKRWT